MEIVVFGATGLTGKKLIEKAVERNIKVKVLVRSPDKLGDMSSKVQIITGDYFDKTAIKKAIAGAEAVISTIGPPTGWRRKLSPDDYETAMKNVVEIMQEEGIDRFVYLASAGTSYSGEKITYGRKMMRGILSIIAPLVIPSKEKELSVLMNSDLNWTSIRPPIIAENVKGDFRINEYSTVGNKVNVHQLVEFMLDCINSATWTRKAPFVGTN